jgi:16S rRNA (cytosine1402-N4)-methyltransferase
VHSPVLPGETLGFLQPERGGLYVDVTVGLGGHAEALLTAAPGARLLGLDRDPETLEIAKQRLVPFGDRVELVRRDYRHLAEVLEERGRPRVAGILADLGVSSLQILSPERGFSIRNDGPLDMRMDRSSGETAAELIASLPEEELANIIYEYGGERLSRRIARGIVWARERGEITTTGRLAEIVARSAGGRRGRIHPATRTFQALRIAVNDEMEGLERFLEVSVNALEVGGRLAVITFHSLEDRAVKRSMRSFATRCSCPKRATRCECGSPNLLRILTRSVVRPGAGEIAANPRSRSAKLRAAERL